MALKPKKNDDETVVSTLFGAVKVPKEEEYKVEKTSPFEYVSDLSQNKKYLFDEKGTGYLPFIINKALSAHTDLLSDVVFLNSNHHLDSKMQHDYLFYKIPKRNRWKKDGWLKKSEAEKKEYQLIQDMAKALRLNQKRVRQLLKLLNQEQLQRILDGYVYPDAKNHKK